MIARASTSNAKFKKGATILAGGTVVGHTIVLASTPVLSRMYTPEDFALLGMYLGAANFLSGMASLRYEQAILSVNSNLKSAEITWTCLVLCGMSSVAAAIIFAGAISFDFLGFGILSLWTVPLMGLSILGTAVFVILRYWQMRQDEFVNAAKMTAWQSLGKTIIQVTAGAGKLGPAGLIVGEAGGRVLGIGRLYRASLNSIRALAPSLNWQSVKSTMIEYREFAIVGLPSTAINSAAVWLVVPFATTYHGVALAGLLTLSQRIVGAPVSLLAQSTGDALQKYFTDAWVDSPEKALQFLYQTVWRLGLIAVPLFTMGAIASLTLVPAIFGEKWLLAGPVIAAMMPWAIFASVVSPLSRIVFIVHLQKLKLGYDVGSLCAMVGSFMFAKHFQMGSTETVLTFSIFQSVVYLAFGLVLVYSIASKVKNSNAK